MPAVSICIPTYKNIDSLRTLLKSIEIQTFKDFEVVITDDTPDDSVESLVKPFIAKYLIHYQKNRPQIGTPGNWNESVKFAKGEYLKIMHHDDWFATETALQSFVTLMNENPDCDFGFSACSNHNEKTGEIQKHFATNHEIETLSKFPAIVLMKNFIGAPSTTIFRKRNIIEFDTNLKWLVDAELYTRFLLENNRCFVYSDQPLVNVTMCASSQVSAGIGSDPKVVIPEVLYIFKKFDHLIPKDYYIFLMIWKNFEEFRITHQDGILGLKNLQQNQIHVIKGIFNYVQVYGYFHKFLPISSFLKIAKKALIYLCFLKLKLTKSDITRA